MGLKVYFSFDCVYLLMHVNQLSQCILVRHQRMQTWAVGAFCSQVIVRVKGGRDLALINLVYVLVRGKGVGDL